MTMSRAGIGAAIVLVALGSLRGDPAETPTIDPYGEPLPAGARLRLGRPLVRQSAGIWDLVFAPDGKTLAATQGKTVCLWDLASGRELRRFEGHTGICSAVAFTPDGKTLISQAADWTLRFWEVASGKELRRISGLKFTCLALTPDGKTLAAGSFDKVIALYDVDSGKELKRLAGHQQTVRRVAFSGDGCTLVSAGDGKNVRLWEVASGKQLRALPQLISVHRTLALSPDGKLLAVQGKDNALLFLDAAEGKEIRRLERIGARDGLSFSRDGKKLVAACGDRRYRIWDVGTMQVERELEAARFGRSVALSPDGRLLAGGDSDETFRVWDLATGKELHHFPGRLGQLTAALAAPDGKAFAVTTCEPAALWLFDRAGRPLLTVPAPPYRPAALRFSVDGKKLAAAVAPDRVRLWEIDTLKELPAIAAEAGESFHALAFSPDGKLLASVTPLGTVRLRQADSGRLLRECEEPVVSRDPDDEDYAPAPFLSNLSFSPDGRHLLSTTGFDPFCRVWEVDSGRIVRQLGRAPMPRGNQRSGWAQAIWSPDGRLILGAAWSYDRDKNQRAASLQLWEVASAEKRLDIPVTGGVAWPIVCAPDGQMLFTGSPPRGDTQGSIRRWDLRTGKELAPLPGHVAAVQALEFVPGTGELISASNDTTALVWKKSALEAARPAPTPPQDEQAVKDLWSVLAGPADKAHAAISRLALAPELTVACSRERLRVAEAVDAQTIGMLIAALEAEEFAAREDASARLEKLGEQAGPALRAALDGNSDLEARRRIDLLLVKLGQPVADPATLQAIRAIELLEQIGTSAAGEVLKKVAGGPHGPLTREAQAALRRLSK